MLFIHILLTNKIQERKMLVIAILTKFNKLYEFKFLLEKYFEKIIFLKNSFILNKINYFRIIYTNISTYFKLKVLYFPLFMITNDTCLTINQNTFL